MASGTRVDRGGGGTSFAHAVRWFALLRMCIGVAQWYRPSGPLRLDKIADQFCDIDVRIVRPMEVESRDA